MKNLVEIFNKYGIELNENQQKQFETYFNYLVEQNKIMNLTTITEEKEVVVKHFLDSVLPSHLFDKGAKVVDVGSGAGFPAVPLKILRPDLTFFMVDSLQKRTFFLKEVIKKLNLSEIFAIHSRAEDFCAEHRETFDVATARAVAPLNTLVEYLLPLLKIGGKAIVYKASKLDEELEQAQAAIKILGGKVEKVENFNIDEFDLQRNVLVIRKISSTPKKYPRQQNKPKTSPLH